MPTAGYRNWLTDYEEDITYDPNGNILTYNRNGSPSIPGETRHRWTQLGHNYIPGKNQLRQVTDNPVYSSNYTEDIDNQANPNNYTYDQIGNLKTDIAEGITNINGTAYGKISSIAKSNGMAITYTYDAEPATALQKLLLSSAGVGAPPCMCGMPVAM